MATSSQQTLLSTITSVLDSDIVQSFISFLVLKPLNVRVEDKECGDVLMDRPIAPAEIDQMKACPLSSIRYSDTGDLKSFKVWTSDKEYLEFSNRDPSRGELRGSILREALDKLKKSKLKLSIYDALTIIIKDQTNDINFFADMLISVNKEYQHFLLQEKEGIVRACSKLSLACRNYVIKRRGQGNPDGESSSLLIEVITNNAQDVFRLALDSKITEEDLLKYLEKETLQAQILLNERSELTKRLIDLQRVQKEQIQLLQERLQKEKMAWQMQISPALKEQLQLLRNLRLLERQIQDLQQQIGILSTQSLENQIFFMQDAIENNRLNIQKICGQLPPNVEYTPVQQKSLIQPVRQSWLSNREKKENMLKILGQSESAESQKLREEVRVFIEEWKQDLQKQLQQQLQDVQSIQALPELEDLQKLQKRQFEISLNIKNIQQLQDQLSLSPLSPQAPELSKELSTIVAQADATLAEIISIASATPSGKEPSDQLLGAVQRGQKAYNELIKLIQEISQRDIGVIIESAKACAKGIFDAHKEVLSLSLIATEQQQQSSSWIPRIGTSWIPGLGLLSRASAQKKPPLESEQLSPEMQWLRWLNKQHMIWDTAEAKVMGLEETPQIIGVAQTADPQIINDLKYAAAQMKRLRMSTGEIGALYIDIRRRWNQILSSLPILPRTQGNVLWLQTTRWEEFFHGCLKEQVDQKEQELKVMSREPTTAAVETKPEVVPPPTQPQLYGTEEIQRQLTVLKNQQQQNILQPEQLTRDLAMIVGNTNVAIAELVLIPSPIDNPKLADYIQSLTKKAKQAIEELTKLLLDNPELSAPLVLKAMAIAEVAVEACVNAGIILRRKKEQQPPQQQSLLSRTLWWAPSRLMDLSASLLSLAPSRVADLSLSLLRWWTPYQLDRPSHKTPSPTPSSQPSPPLPSPPQQILWLLWLYEQYKNWDYAQTMEDTGQQTEQMMSQIKADMSYLEEQLGLHGIAAEKEYINIRQQWNQILSRLTVLPRNEEELALLQFNAWEDFFIRCVTAKKQEQESLATTSAPPPP